MKGFCKEQGCHELFSVQYYNKLQKMFRLLIFWYACSSLPTVKIDLFRTSLDTLVFLKHGSMKDSRDNFSSSPFEIHPVFIPGQGWRWQKGWEWQGEWIKRWTGCYFVHFCPGPPPSPLPSLPSEYKEWFVYLWPSCSFQSRRNHAGHLKFQLSYQPSSSFSSWSLW